MTLRMTTASYWEEYGHGPGSQIWHILTVLTVIICWLVYIFEHLHTKTASPYFSHNFPANNSSVGLYNLHLSHPHLYCQFVIDSISADISNFTLPHKIHWYISIFCCSYGLVLKLKVIINNIIVLNQGVQCEFHYTLPSSICYHNTLIKYIRL